MTTSSFLTKKIDRTPYINIAIPTPPHCIQRMLDNLDVPADVFILDLVHHSMYSDPVYEPFINTIMEVPSHVLIDGLSISKQLTGLRHTILTWFHNSDFSEFTAILKALDVEFTADGLVATATDATLAGSIAIVEFELTTV